MEMENSMKKMVEFIKENGRELTIMVLDDILSIDIFLNYSNHNKFNFL